MRQAQFTQRRLAALLLVVMLPLFAAPLRAEPPASEQEQVQPSTIRGRFLLMNHFGQAVTDQDFWGKFVLITFGYTFCPDICPTTLANMGGALKQLGGDAEQIHALFVSVDPQRDTAEGLKNYVTYFHPQIIGLTGSPELVKRAAENFNVRYEKVLEPGRDPDMYSVDHSAGIYLMSPGGHFLAKFAHILPPKELAERIRFYLDQNRG